MPSKSFFLIAGFALLLGGCGRSEEPKTAAVPAASATPARMGQSTLVGSESAQSLTALADSIRARALRGDTVGVVRLMMNDSAYRRHVYPVSPAYDSTREEVFQFVVGMHKANSIKGMKRLLRDIGEPSYGPAVANGFRGIPASGGTLYEAPSKQSGRGVLLFSSVFCQENGCQVVSFAEAGAFDPGSAE